MADPIAAIVGLGNPGPRYAETRHNAGYAFLVAVAGDLGAELRPEQRFRGWTARGQVDGHPVRLLAPQTFMNRSGSSVAEFVRFFKIPLHQVLIAHDDLDLAPGVVRVKVGGGHGGHNGLRDIINHLGAPDFVRVRIGIGHPGSSSQVTSYVLQPPTPEEKERINDSIQAARQELPKIVRGDFELAMNSLHSPNREAPDPD